jgi:hypothetical protein
MRAQTRGRQLAFLMQQVALGDQNQRPRCRDLLDRFADIVEQFDRMRQEIAPHLENAGQQRPGTAPSKKCMAVSIMESVSPLAPKP